MQTFSPYSFDDLTRSVTWDGGCAQLTAKEFDLALIFFQHLGEPLTREHLLRKVWGYSLGVATRTLDAHVCKLRRKLGLRPANGFRLAPLYTFGYRLDRVA